MRQRFNDLLHLDDDGLIHFPDDWTEEAKENWMADMREASKGPPDVPGMEVVYVKGIYRENEDEKEEI